MLPLVVPTPDDPATNDVWGQTVNAALAAVNNIIVRKTADEPINATTLQNDDHLVAAVEANAVYAVEWWLRMDGPAANDFKYSWVGPAGATMVWHSLGRGSAVAAATPAAIGDAPFDQDGPTIGTVINHGTVAAGTFTSVKGSGYLAVAGTAGSLQMQWAQIVAAASTTLRIGSWLRLERIA